MTRKEAEGLLAKYGQAGAFLVRSRSDNANLKVLTMLQAETSGKLTTLHLPICENASTGEFNFAGNRGAARSGARYGSLVALIEHCMSDNTLTKLNPGGRGVAMHALVDVFGSTDVRRQTLQVRKCTATVVGGYRLPL